jgi:predicted transcriptional regulator
MAPLPQAIDPRNSISSDGEFIYCIIDGAPMKMLKRYLWRRWRLTPEAYREMFGLPPDYPMTAPRYSLQKREEAMLIGLGTRENKDGRAKRTMEGCALEAELVA